MSFDLSVLVGGLVALGLLWCLTAAVGWRVVRRTRARSREINDQIGDIHRHLGRFQGLIDQQGQQVGQLQDLIDQHAGRLQDLIDQHAGRLQDLIDQQHRRLWRLEELATLDRAAAAVRLARLRGSLSDEAESKLLQHLLDVRESLEVATERGER
jgi:DNA anti-recombination protein RmuC